MKLSRTILGLFFAAAAFAPVAAQAATPMSGVPTQIRRGFYTEMDLGTFFTLGGVGSSVSSPQAYIGLGVGYDVYATEQHFVSLGLGFSMGTSAGGCFGTTYTDDAQSPCVGSRSDLVLSDNWTLTTGEASVLYGYFVGERLMLTGRLLGGLGHVQPDAFEDGGEVLANPIPLVGGGLGLEWATQFDHFSLGLDASMKFLVGPNVPGIAIAPRVKYTF